MSEVIEKHLKVYLIAGEASGDLLGAHLMRELKAQVKGPIRFYGIGGEKMAAEGLASLFPYHELSLLGFVEILPYLYNIFARINTAVEDVLAKQPDVVITIDVPGFAFRVVERLRKENAKSKFVHYVAPTVWAYKPERAEYCAGLFDHMLTLLPFEPPYFEKVGLPCTFVGHPVVAETAAGNGKAFREKYQIDDDTMLLCLLPGSRRSEIRRHMPALGRAANMLSALYPKLAMAVAVPKVMMPVAAPYFEGCPFRAVITANEQDKKDAIAASNLAIVKSGTVTLEVAMAGVPMVITYRVHPLSAWMFKRASLTHYVNLINILQDSEVIPELLQELCDPLMIASASAQLLQPGPRRERQQEHIRSALKQLMPPGAEAPSRIAARTILGLLEPA
jgi:lipid-A-disaccharide synthase